MSTRRHRGVRRRAFTLIEVLMAIALFAGFLTAAVAILFQVSVAWANQADDPIADRHAEGLNRFLRLAVNEGGAAGITAPTATQVSEEHALLSVRPAGDLPIFEDLTTAGGAIEARLCMPPDGGLWLTWNTVGERTQNTSRPHRTRLSPWVTEATLMVYDPNTSRWIEYVPGDTNAGTFGSATSVRVLRVKIVHRGQERRLEIPLPKN